MFLPTYIIIGYTMHILVLLVNCKTIKTMMSVITAGVLKEITSERDTRLLNVKWMWPTHSSIESKLCLLEKASCNNRIVQILRTSFAA